MGSGISKEEKLKRESLEESLKRMHKKLNTTAKTHFESSRYYRKWDIGLQCISSVVFLVSATGGFPLKSAWMRFFLYRPRLAPLVAAISATSIVLSITVRTRLPLKIDITGLPADLHEKHLIAGLECQYLKKRVKFMSETEVWDLKIPWASLASQYRALLREKKDVNSMIQTEEWAHLKAKKLIVEKKWEKRNRPERVAEGTMQ